MKKSTALFLFLLILTFNAVTGPVQMVIMLDTSYGVSGIYNNIIDNVINNVLTRYLRPGDTIHFISYSTEPSLIFSKQIKTDTDLLFMMSELAILKPEGNYTDQLKAIRYLKQFASDIGSGADGSRQVLIITDGKHSPPPESLFSDIVFQNSITGRSQNLLEETVKELLMSNWNISTVRLPDSNNSIIMPEENNLFFHIAKESRIYNSYFKNEPGMNKLQTFTGSPELSYPDNPEIINYNFDLTVNIKNNYNYPVMLKLDKVLDPDTGTDLLSDKLTISLDSLEKKKLNIRLSVPDGIEKGKISLNLKLLFSDNYRAYPDTVTIQPYLKKSFSDYFYSFRNWILYLLITAFIISAIILFIIIFKYYTGVTVSESHLGDETRRPVVMNVSGQNNNVLPGKNINYFEIDSIKTVGGYKASFEIVLYRIPGIIAEIKYTGDAYLFRPVDRTYFPEINDDEIIVEPGVKIKVAADKGRILFISFDKYISPLEKVNSILKSTYKK